MGGTKNPRAHIKRHSFLRDAAQEKACPVVEMPHRAGSRIYTQASKHVGWKQQSTKRLMISTHKSQNDHSGV